MRTAPIAGLVLCVAASGVRVNQAASSQEKARPQFNLITTAQLLSLTHFCLTSDGQFGNALFRLHIRIQNRGGRPVILSRKYTQISCPELAHVGANGNAGDLASHCDTGDSVIDRRYPRHLDQDFVIVQPQNSFEFDGSTGVFF